MSYSSKIIFITLLYLLGFLIQRANGTFRDYFEIEPTNNNFVNKTFEVDGRTIKKLQMKIKDCYEHNFLILLVVDSIREEYENILSILTKKLEEVGNDGGIEIKKYICVPQYPHEKLYDWPLFAQFHNRETLHFITFFQFYLCSPHIQKFIKDELGSNKNTAIKMFAEILKTDFEYEGSESDLKNVINDKMVYFLLDLLLDFRITCNIMWCDNINDYSLTELLGLLCYKVRLKWGDVEHDAYRLEDGSFPLNLFDISRETNSLYLSEGSSIVGENFPNTIILWDTEETKFQFEYSILSLEEKKYYSISCLICDESKKRNFLVVKEPTGWKKLDVNHKMAYDWSTLRYENKIILYMFVTE